MRARTRRTSSVRTAARRTSVAGFFIALPLVLVLLSGLSKFR